MKENNSDWKKKSVSKKSPVIFENKITIENKRWKERHAMQILTKSSHIQKFYDQTGKKIT